MFLHSAQQRNDEGGAGQDRFTDEKESDRPWSPGIKPNVNSDGSSNGFSVFRVGDYNKMGTRWGGGAYSVTRGSKEQDEEEGDRKNNDCLPSGSAHILQFVKTIQFASG